MKKVISFILTVLMLAGAIVTVGAVETSPFTDVKTSRWSYEAIKYAVEKGYMNGVGGGKFDPAGSMTRAMVVTVLYRREGSPAVTFRNDFTDVKAGNYYSDAVIWAKDEGVVNGITETTFEPNGKITREQLATMLSRFSERCLVSVPERADISGYPDADKIHSYAMDALAWANEANLIKGMSDGTLSPRGNATREQFAAILERFDNTFNLVYNEPVVRSHYSEPDYPLVDNADVYVSADGSDDNPGTLDAPLATFNRAVERVREIKAIKTEGDIVVAFKAGNYGPLSVTLTAEDSGSENRRVVYCKYGDGDVIFNNGFDVSEDEFTDLTDAEKSLFPSKSAANIKKVDVSSRLTVYDPRKALVLGDNGEMTLARFPNKYSDGTDALIQGAHETLDDDHIQILVSLLTRKFEKYHTTEGLLLYGYLTTGWYKDLLSTDEYDPATGIFHIPHPEQSRAGHLRYIALDGFDSRFWSNIAVVNISEELDAKGEYWIDSTSGTFYVYEPEGGYHFTGGGETMLTLNSVSYVTLRGLDFRNSLGKMIWAGDNVGLTFEGCVFSGCADDSMVNVERTKDLSVRGCEFSFAAMTALSISGPNNIGRYYLDTGVRIDNNLFTRTSLVKGNSGALSFGRTSDTQVTHNEFRLCYWEGVDFRGASNMVAEYNVFDRVCYNGDDTGALNNWSSYNCCGNKIRYNLFICIKGGSNGRYCEYLDDSAGTEVYSNLYYDCDNPEMNNDIDKFNTFCNNVTVMGGNIPSCSTSPIEIVDEALATGDMTKITSSGYYVKWKNESSVFDGYPEVKEILAERWPGYFDITTDLDRIKDSEFCMNNTIKAVGNRAITADGNTDPFGEKISRYSTIEDNLGYTTEENPFFVNPTIGDYRMKDGAPIAVSIPFEKIGRY
ncbi:MAG: S-layer homology domain-containing protein [Clostridia bacterium]|nr:S-layer homology domain-containing protein [Clostridia bacterium]